MLATKIYRTRKMAEKYIKGHVATVFINGNEFYTARENLIIVNTLASVKRGERTYGIHKTKDGDYGASISIEEFTTRVTRLFLSLNDANAWIDRVRKL